MTIKLPLVDALVCTMLGRSMMRRPMKYASLEQTIGEHPDRRYAGIDYQVTATFNFRHIIASEEMRRDPDTVARVKGRALRAFCRELYGPVEAELRIVLEELWEEGLHDHAVAKRIEAMLPALRGEGRA